MSVDEPRKEANLTLMSDSRKRSDIRLSIARSTPFKFSFFVRYSYERCWEANLVVNICYWDEPREEANLMLLLLMWSFICFSMLSRDDVVIALIVVQKYKSYKVMCPWDEPRIEANLVLTLMMLILWSMFPIRLHAPYFQLLRRTYSRYLACHRYKANHIKQLKY